MSGQVGPPEATRSRPSRVKKRLCECMRANAARCSSPRHRATLSLLVLSLTTTYQLDEQGIRVSYALVSKSEQRVKWRKVTSVHVHEGPVDRMLGLATVTVTAYGTGTTLRLLAIPQAAIVRDEVDRRMVAHASLETWLGDD